MKYNPKAIDAMHISSEKKDYTDLSSDMRPLIAKYRNPPDVKARHCAM
jgi:hypothetical protein